MDQVEADILEQCLTRLDREVIAALVFLAHENDLGTRGIDFQANVWDPMQRVRDL